MTRLDDIAKGVRLGDVGRASPQMAALLRRVGMPMVKLFHRPTFEGAEHLPTSGAFLLVANHSAGLGIAEIISFATLYSHHVGSTRPLAGFAHPTGFRVWPLSAVLRAVGAIPSTYAAADAALERGISLLVFPGGDHETMRPLWQAHTVDLGGRVGFLKIARKHGIPIVPMGIRGSHFTAPILFRSQLLSTLLFFPRFVLGAKRWSLSLLGLLGTLGILGLPLSWPVRAASIWLWLGSALTLFPYVPWTIHFRIGAPIPAEILFPSVDSGDADLPSALKRVQDEMQALVARGS